MNNVIRDSIVSVIRQLLGFALGGFTGWATSHGLQVGAQVTLLIGIAAVMIVNILWAVTGHLLAKWKVNVALLLEPGATNRQLDAAVAAVPVLQQLQEAITTPAREAPGAPLAVKL